MRRYLLFVMSTLLLVTPVAAQITMDQTVIGSGGGKISNGTMQMELTIGQPVIGMVQSETTSNQFGFWWQISMVPTAVEETAGPLRFSLRQNAPNPFTFQTRFNFVVAHGPTPITLTIFDPQGRLVRTVVNEPKTAGMYAVLWDGKNDGGQPVATGIYFAKFSAGKFQQTRKLVLLK